MELSGTARLLRIFIGESDTLHGVSVYEKIVLSAKKEGLAGATVTRGIMGFGGNSMIHTAKILRLSDDLPVVIEIADSEEKIMCFLPALKSIFEESGSGGLVTMEKVEIIRYAHSVKH